MTHHLKLVASNVSCGDPAPGRAPLSRSEVLDRHRMQAISPEIWSGFLHAGFRNPEEVAAFFQVRNSTAWNWWTATNRPSADKVMIAVLELPGFVDHLAAAVAENLRRAA